MVPQSVLDLVIALVQSEMYEILRYVILIMIVLVLYS
jgi:hypothetical protein